MLYNEWTYEMLYRWGREELTLAEVPDAALDARLLLEWCCGTDRNTLLAHGDREISQEEKNRYKAAVVRRQSRVSLQQITGAQEFMGLTFAVDENVLVPRQDTEILVEEVLRNLHDGMRILDLCTGSGCILLSLLYYSNDCTGIGTDLSPEALQTAERNAEMTVRTGTGERALCAAFLQSDLFRSLPGEEKFDIIVSNPPYIRTSVIETLMPEVKNHEPRMALDGGEDGLSFYRQIAAQAGGYLYSGGMLFMEIGYDQGEEVSRLLEDAGFKQIEVFQDYGGNDRVVQGVCSPRGLR